jgi:hypothetical protein
VKAISGRVFINRLMAGGYRAMLETTVAEPLRSSDR